MKFVKFDRPIKIIMREPIHSFPGKMREVQRFLSRICAHKVGGLINLFRLVNHCHLLLIVVSFPILHVMPHMYMCML